jgi:3-methyladenine DNA glycosylase/8-oxoguanine DNA glycosylase
MVLDAGVREPEQGSGLARAPAGDLVTTTIEFPLLGPGGEPVDLIRTLNSHGFVDLPPLRPAPDYRSLELTVPLGRVRPRVVRIEPGGPGLGRVVVLGPAISPGAADRILEVVRRVLRLDADLSAFYAMAASDPALSWVTTGAGRMLQSPTVFEDVVKTICTTNCAWSATVRMVNALVANLGEPAAGVRADGAYTRAFPTAIAMAEAPERFYRDVVRAGYRGAYLIRLARAVAAGELDLEALGNASADELDDEELAARLLALPGVGPYAAAHIMMTTGRYSRLILDSWSRPTYAKLVRRRAVPDASIVRRFRRYGPYAGLAFWLVITRDWVELPT